MTNTAPEAEAELEVFRQKWRDEVSARNKPTSQPSSHGQIRSEKEFAKAKSASTSHVAAERARDSQVVDYPDEIEPRTYHDLPEKEAAGQQGRGHGISPSKEPVTALEHYEWAVEKETQGQLGDSIRHYRRAFRLDDDVHEAYKKKHFPPSYFAKVNSAAAAQSTISVHPNRYSADKDSAGLSSSLRQMVDDFSSLRIEPPPPSTDLSPPTRSLLGELPEEILHKILFGIAFTNIAAFMRLTQVCKRLAYLVLTEENIWKQVATESNVGFQAMHYDFVCNTDGSLIDPDSKDTAALVHEDDTCTDSSLRNPSTDTKLNLDSLAAALMISKYGSSWREMFRSRPRLRFNGCYISTVNYTRAGAANTNSLTWGAPVHIVTYYRYIRFFRDGTVISLLTTAEPVDVVHYLTKTNMHNNHRNDSMLPTAVMKDALRGRWRLSGPGSSSLDPVNGEQEAEGDVHVETMGVVPKYTYRMHLSLSHAGSSARNNKLTWKGYWSHNRLTDDVAAFGLKNDRAFYWSRVKSYGMGYD